MAESRLDDRSHEKYGQPVLSTEQAGPTKELGERVAVLLLADDELYHDVIKNTLQANETAVDMGENAENASNGQVQVPGQLVHQARKGSLYSHGQERDVELGLLTEAYLDRILTAQLPVKQVALGAAHYMFLTDNGQVFAIGSNSHGQCGVGDPGMCEPTVREVGDQNEYVPQARVVPDLNAQSIACGKNHSAAVTKDNVLKMAGNREAFFKHAMDIPGDTRMETTADQLQQTRNQNRARKMGDRANVKAKLTWRSCHQGYQAFVPVLEGVSSVGCKGLASVVGFLNGDLGQWQIPWALDCTAHLERLRAPLKSSGQPYEWEQVELGLWFACARSKCGKVYSWGSNCYGELGAQSEADIMRIMEGSHSGPNPRASVGRASAGPRSSAHSRSSSARTSLHHSGSIELGKKLMSNEPLQTRSVPQLVALRQQATFIACGDRHGVAVLITGKVVTWGDNRRGQCGVGQSVNLSQPVAFVHLPDNEIIKTCYAGPTSSFCCSTAGRLYLWGANQGSGVISVASGQSYVTSGHVDQATAVGEDEEGDASKIQKPRNRAGAPVRSASRDAVWKPMFAGGLIHRFVTGCASDTGRTIVVCGPSNR